MCTVACNSMYNVMGRRLLPLNHRRPMTCRRARTGVRAPLRARRLASRRGRRAAQTTTRTGVAGAAAADAGAASRAPVRRTPVQVHTAHARSREGRSKDERERKMGSGKGNKAAAHRSTRRECFPTDSAALSDTRHTCPTLVPCLGRRTPRQQTADRTRTRGAMHGATQWRNAWRGAW